MTEIMRQAKRLQNEFINHRRYLHENAEIGFHLPKTRAYVKKALLDMGYNVTEDEKSGFVTTMVGMNKKNGCILLRADMDALPIMEQTKLSYACKRGHMHACGHDMHTTMLLGGAKLLKMHEKELKGQVKLLFQPAEEVLEGARAAIESGILQNPPIKAAFSMHVATGTELPTGTVVMQKGVGAPSADYFKITVQGKGCHGSSPWEGRDPITVAARILLGVQEITARELSLKDRAVLTVGAFQAGNAGNAIPSEAVLCGTLRAYDDNTRERIKKRLQEIATHIAKAFQCKALTEFQGGAPALFNDEKMTDFLYAHLQTELGKEKVLLVEDTFGGASEDFAYIAKEVPSVMIGISAGASADGYGYPLHNSKTTFDEEVLWQGSGIFARVALGYFDK